MSRRRRTKQIESRLGRRSPKRLPTKHLSWTLWIDWPHAGPSYGVGLRTFVKRARLRESREAWRIEAMS